MNKYAMYVVINEKEELVCIWESNSIAEAMLSAWRAGPNPEITQVRISLLNEKESRRVEGIIEEANLDFMINNPTGFEKSIKLLRERGLK